MNRVLFICNGNIFRSMTAEYALRAQLPEDSDVEVVSAGVTAKPQEVLPLVRARLIEHGVDPSAHRQRKLTGEILNEADLAVAINLDHQAHVRETYGREIPLFNRICFGRDEGLLDIGEFFENWREVPDEVDEYVVKMVDTIWDAIPALVVNSRLNA